MEKEIKEKRNLRYLITVIIVSVIFIEHLHGMGDYHLREVVGKIFTDLLIFTLVATCLSGMSEE